VEWLIQSTQGVNDNETSNQFIKQITNFKFLKKNQIIIITCLHLLNLTNLKNYHKDQTWEDILLKVF